MLQPCSRACMQSQVTAPQSRLPLNFCMLRQSSPQDFVRHQSFGRSQRAPALRSATPVAAATGQQQSLADLQASNKDAESLKLQIAQQAGSRNGTDADEAARDSVRRLIESLEALNPAQSPVNIDLTGTAWELVYSTSTAASSGKIGPFVGIVEQDFPSAQCGQYINWVTFAGGLIKAKLTANYISAPGREDKLNVQFIDTVFSLGPFQFTKEFDSNRGGWWRLTYIDSDFRILYANTGNVFVLKRIKAEDAAFS